MRRCRGVGYDYDSPNDCRFGSEILGLIPRYQVVYVFLLVERSLGQTAEAD